MENFKVSNLSGDVKNVEATQVEEFKANFSGPLLTHADEEYEEVRKIWNGMHDKKPVFIARCTGVADVIAAVNFARENDILISIRGGGHNVAGTATNDGGIMIDLSLMKGIRVDAENRTAHAQGGVHHGRFGQGNTGIRTGGSVGCGFNYWNCRINAWRRIRLVAQKIWFVHR